MSLSRRSQPRRSYNEVAPLRQLVDNRRPRNLLPFSLSLPRPLTPALSQWEREAEGVSLTVSTLILAFMARGKVRVGVNGNTRSLKHGDGVHRRASAADNAQGGNDEHELIPALFGANLCQGLQ
jgi:hypothetical protein